MDDHLWKGLFISFSMPRLVPHKNKHTLKFGTYIGIYKRMIVLTHYNLYI